MTRSMNQHDQPGCLFKINTASAVYGWFREMTIMFIILNRSLSQNVIQDCKNIVMIL